MDPTLMAAIFSAIGPILSSFGGGKEGQYQSTYSPQQQGSQNQYLQGIDYGSQDVTQDPSYQTGASYLNDLFNDPNFFNKFEAPMQRDFHEKTIPGLFNQFAGMGSGGSQNSSAFRNAALEQGRTLQEKIASLRGGMQQQAVPQLLGYAQQPTSNFMNQYGQGQQNQQNNIYRPATPGVLGEVGANLTGASSGIWGDLLNNIFSGKGGSQNQQQQQPTVGLGQNSGLATRSALAGGPGYAGY